MLIKPITDLDTISNFLKTQPNSELLQSPLWAKVQQADGRRVFYIELIDELPARLPAASMAGGRMTNDELNSQFAIRNSQFINPQRAACLIIKHQLPLGKSWLYSPRLNWPSEQMPQLIDEIAKIAKKENAIFWKIESIEELRIACPLACGKHGGRADCGLKQSIRNSQFAIHQSANLQPQETFIIDLTQSEDQLLKNMKPKTRYNIKLAQKKAVQVRWSTNIAYINIFYDLLTATARRQKIKIHPKIHYQNILKILGDDNAAALAIAEIDKKPAAANLVTFFGDTAAYLHGGTDDSYKAIMAPYLLQWEAILEAKRRGCRYYDMGGCAVKTGKINQWAGITRFKAGFNGELKQFGPAYDIVFNRAWHWGYKTLTLLCKACC